MVAGTAASVAAVGLRSLAAWCSSEVRARFRRRLFASVEVSETEDPRLFKALVRWLERRRVLASSGSFRAVAAEPSASGKPNGPRAPASFRPRDDVCCRCSASSSRRGSPSAARRSGSRSRAAAASAARTRRTCARSSATCGRRPRGARRARPRGAASRPRRCASPRSAAAAPGAAARLCRERSEAADADRRHVEHYEWTGKAWALASLSRKRPAETLVLRAGLAEEILGDVRRFIDDESNGRRPAAATTFERVRAGKPRDIVAWQVLVQRALRAPPARLLPPRPAGLGQERVRPRRRVRVRLPLCALPLGRFVRGGPTLSDAISTAPPAALVAVEDADACFSLGRGASRGAARAAAPEKVAAADGPSLSELLNAEDGVGAAADGRILFITTNRVDALDGALLRPCRCDRSFFLGASDEDQARRLFSAPTTPEAAAFARSGALGGPWPTSGPLRGIAATTGCCRRPGVDESTGS
ncbi:hypothetical protein JL721_13173 [Aureococcus anophagefferens]|nr:hypothetical protein JL721_13173 [Aureococcus anophagefferens]